VLVCIGKPDLAEKAINDYIENIEKVNMHEPSIQNLGSSAE